MASAARVGGVYDRPGGTDKFARPSCAPPAPRFHDHGLPSCALAPPSSPLMCHLNTPGVETLHRPARVSEESAAASTGPLRSLNVVPRSRGDHPGASTSSKRDDAGLVSSDLVDLAMRHRPASLRLADLGLPPAVVDRIVKRGVKTGAMYPWQRAAIDCGSDGSNLVYCAPTSGGKSLVAEVLLIKALMRAGQRLSLIHI